MILEIKNFVIVFLFLSLCSLGGYTVYINSKYNSEIEKLNGKISALIDPSRIVCPSDKKEKSTAEYYKAGRLSEPRKTCEQGLEETYEILLLPDGTFEYSYLSSCSKTNQKGSYTISGNKIALTCNPDVSEQCDGSSKEYMLSEDALIFIDGSGKTLNFKKVLEKELQALYN